MQLTLDEKGAQALRELANKLPVAIDNIVAATETLFGVYNSLSERLGKHNEDFGELLMHIKNAQQVAADALSDLPPKMNATAQKIDQYVATHPKVE